MSRRFMSVPLALMCLTIPTIVSAACPPEVKEARDLLTAKAATAKKLTPPKTLAASRGQEVQAAFPMHVLRRDAHMSRDWSSC
jgi:hypothetical protein